MRLGKGRGRVEGGKRGGRIEGGYRWRKGREWEKGEEGWRLGKF